MEIFKYFSYFLKKTLHLFSWLEVWHPSFSLEETQIFIDDLLCLGIQETYEC